MIGRYYLPLHIPSEVYMYKILTAENHVQRFGHSSQVFLAGDLNMRLEVQEGDTRSTHVCHLT